MTDIKGKVAIVTGSGTGVGAATARLLASLGCHVVINYSRSAAAAEQVAHECEALGVQTLVCRANVANDDDCRAMVDQALTKWGHVDILVNNAGTTKFCDHRNLDGLSSDDFLSIYAVNVVGPFQMIRAVARAMQSQAHGGVVVNVASTAAVTGVGSSVAYAASKGALVTMTLSLARALGPEIRINAVCPGFIQGDWLRKGLGDEQYEAAKSHNERNAPLGVTACPDTVADAILHFIIGPQIITGETLMVDGGRHLNSVPLGRR
ncbi:MAG: SDR family oxidoreductase [Gammaproteobacteria bacterium]|nr:SDR family oxidoreductase [Gammaproteobacteria bacterium]MDP2140806.1 SDR family oxidoreductase [Gammaproteobacteria bacterium]MDP2347552.1 SDR family oxidoreductase [Gammaproteobacteria bacterium]